MIFVRRRCSPNPRPTNFLHIATAYLKLDSQRLARRVRLMRLD
jgi:hypothetical protein